MTHQISDNGWIIPKKEHSTYSTQRSQYYKLGNYDDKPLFNIIKAAEYFKLSIDQGQALSSLASLKDEAIKSSIGGIFDGPHIPFLLPSTLGSDDVGNILETSYFPLLASSAELNGISFKYTLQGNDSNLSGSLAPLDSYRQLLHASSDSCIVGYYFPLALEGYSPSSQLSAAAQLQQMSPVPVTLSGPLEICSSLIVNNNLVFNKESYSQILCASAVQHRDSRLMLCFKTYGTGLEAWLMSKMLTPTMEQVSEQWSGGLTLYCQL